MTLIKEVGTVTNSELKKIRQFLDDEELVAQFLKVQLLERRLRDAKSALRLRVGSMFYVKAIEYAFAIQESICDRMGTKSLAGTIKKLEQNFKPEEVEEALSYLLGIRKAAVFYNQARKLRKEKNGV